MAQTEELKYETLMRDAIYARKALVAMRSFIECSKDLKVSDIQTILFEYISVGLQGQERMYDVG